MEKMDLIVKFCGFKLNNTITIISKLLLQSIYLYFFDYFFCK